MVETTQTAFRLPSELLARIDTHVERMRADTPGLKVTRADAVRVLLNKALEIVENGQKAETNRKGRK